MTSSSLGELIVVLANLGFRGLCETNLGRRLVVAPKESPALRAFTVCLEGRFRLGFCQAVTQLFVGWTFDDGELFSIAGIPEPVPFRQEILSPVGDSLVGSQEASALVVFKHVGMKSDVFQWVTSRVGDDLFDKPPQGKKRAERGRESTVLGFQCRLGEMRCKLTLPDDRPTTE